MGILAEQPMAYPQNFAAAQSCCHERAKFTPLAPQGLQPRKCAPALGKTGLSTQQPLLYYYCY
jgi:hypothetical protein